jgi:hypothetical protein
VRATQTPQVVRPCVEVDDLLGFAADCRECHWVRADHELDPWVLETSHMLGAFVASRDGIGDEFAQHPRTGAGRFGFGHVLIRETAYQRHERGIRPGRRTTASDHAGFASDRVDELLDQAGLADAG